MKKILLLMVFLSVAGLVVGIHSVLNERGAGWGDFFGKSILHLKQSLGWAKKTQNLPPPPFPSHAKLKNSEKGKAFSVPQKESKKKDVKESMSSPTSYASQTQGLHTQTIPSASSPSADLQQVIKAIDILLKQGGEELAKAKGIKDKTDRQETIIKILNTAKKAKAEADEALKKASSDGQARKILKEKEKAAEDMTNKAMKLLTSPPQ